MSSEAGPFRIRDLETFEELQACVALQEEVWGRGFAERVPTAILGASRRLGGVVAGAFDPGERLVGFVFGMTGLEGGEPLHWSDMLAVLPEAGGQGLGRRLKLHQRASLLERGVRRVLWTFDPLESRNAHLNLARLGVVARRYVRDMYGSSGSPLHRGIGTDRLVAHWYLDSPRVAARVGEGDSAPLRVPDGVPAVLGAEVGAGGGLPRPGAVRTSDASVVSVAIPARIQELKAADPDLALAWREVTREVLSEALARGREVRELVRAGDISHYLLVDPEADAACGDDGRGADHPVPDHGTSGGSG